MKSEKNSGKSEINSSKSKSSEFSRQDEEDDTDEVQEDGTRLDGSQSFPSKLDSKDLNPHELATQRSDFTAPQGRFLPRSMENVFDVRQREQMLLQEGQDQMATNRVALDTFASDAENRIDSAAAIANDSFIGGGGLAAKLRASQHGLTERLLSGQANLNGGSDNELLQQLLNQHAQQHHSQQLDMQFRQQQQQQQQAHQQPQSALQQLLSRQHHQREQQQHASHRSLEEARRLLHQQAQSHHQQQVLSNLYPSWSAGSQLLQAQTRMQQAQLAAAMQQDGGGSIGSSVSDLADGT